MVRRDARLHVKETLGLRMGILVTGRKMRVLSCLATISTYASRIGA